MSVLHRLARRSLPQTEGTIRLRCLEAPVEVLRDRYGIPHIYAGSREDLARAQGYVHAQDRLFQMESLRRFAFGRLAEMVGPRGVELDRAARRMRLRWAAERDAAAADPGAAAVATAYAEGVNAFLAHGPLPLELRLLRLRPEPWSSVDVLAPAQMFALALSGNWDAELARTRIAQRVGAERMRRLDPSYPPDHPLIVPAAAAERTIRFGRTLRERLGLGASNAFVVAGSRTVTGRPLLANDPHLLLGAPSIWHAQHVAWDGGEWIGFTVPGAPALILGRNRRVAWGMTTAMVDTQDLFVERLHPDDPTRYDVDGEWVQGEVVREPIRVRGRRAPVVEAVLVTRHGPVVVDPEPGAREALALAWSAHEPAETTRALLDLETAGSVEEADRALARFGAPPHSFLLADADGAIGYRLAGGPVPRRRHGDGSVPTPGWDSQNDWAGFLDDAELPRLRDPERAFVVSANNRIVDDDRLPGEYLSGYRARRLDALVDREEPLTPQAAWAFLLDLLSLPGLELVEALRGFESEDPLEARALELLRAWDGEHRAESAGAAVYAALMRALECELYAEAGSDPLVGGAADPLPNGLFERARPLVLAALAARDPDVLPAGRTWEDVVASALATAARTLGPDVSSWRRGRLHRVRFAHPLDALPGAGRVFSRGPYPVGGDGDTVHVMARVPVGSGSMIGPSMRAVYDLADPNGTLVSLAPGQSGHPASPHYDDLLPGWLRGESITVPMDRDRVEELVEARLRLVPRALAE